MKYFLLILTTFSLSFGFSQNEDNFLSKAILVDQTLRIDKLLGVDLTQGEYSISFVVDTPRYAHGNRVSFNDSMFYSYYTAPCGNDYFTHLYGAYRILSGNVLEINIQVIDYHGEWDPPKPMEHPEENWQRFKVSKSEEGFLFVRLQL